MQFSMNGKVSASIADMLDIPAGRVTFTDRSSPYLSGGSLNHGWRRDELPVLTSLRVGHGGHVTGSWGKTKIQNASYSGMRMPMGNHIGKSMASWYYREPMFRGMADLAVALHHCKYLWVDVSRLRLTPLIFVHELLSIPNSFVMHYARNMGRSWSIQRMLGILQRGLVSVPMWSTLFERASFSRDYLPKKFSCPLPYHMYNWIDSVTYFPIQLSSRLRDYVDLFPTREPQEEVSHLRRKIYGATIPGKRRKQAPKPPRVLFRDETPAQIAAWVNR